jgi:osmotically inducible lipoprotein OsmB
MFMKKVAILLVVATLALGGCTNMNATTAQRALAGGAVGASGGALIGWAAGSPAIGAGVGGGLGLVGGLLYDQYEKNRGY